MKYIRTIFDMIFNFVTFMVLSAAGTIYIIVLAADNDVKMAEKKREQTEYCYSQSMVLVKTEAGSRCVLPQHLVELK